MKPSELFQKELVRHGREQRKHLVVKRVLEQLNEYLDVERIAGVDVHCEARVRLSLSAQHEITPVTGHLPANVPAVMAKNSGTSTIMPSTYYDRNKDRYEGWMLTRVMSVFYKVEFPPNRTVVSARWYHRLPSETVIFVIADIKNHQFTTRSEKREGKVVKESALGTQIREPEKRVWIYEEPEYMEGHDHIQWWTDGTGPKDRDYYRLDAHGWDG